MLQFFRKEQRKTDIECDIADIDSSDYTIMVEDIPKKIEVDDYDDDLKNHLQANLWGSNRKANVEEINLVYK